MKDKLRELAERWSAKDPVCEAGVITITMNQCAAELLAILDAEGDGGAVGKVPSGWEIRWHTEGDDSLLLITHRKHGGVGAHKDATDARTIPEEMLYLLARDLLTTNTHPARSGVVSDEDVSVVAKMIADRVGNGMREKYEELAKHIVEHFAKGERHER